MNEFTNVTVNPSQTVELIRLRSPLRRRIILGTAVAALFPSVGVAAQKGPSFAFEGVPLSSSSDDVILPAGYRWSVVAAWGDPIDGQGKPISPDVDDTAEMQERQFGMHHDGGAFFPEKGSSSKGVWIVNHEYTDDGLLHPGGMTPWTAEKVKKSQAAHGVTVSTIERQAGGSWRPVPSPATRRITANTLCDVAGPARGHALMRTAADSDGIAIRGTLNNCAHGVTPWGTYLTCEENFNGYFVKTGSLSPEERRVGLDAKGFGYRWQEFDDRFDAGKHPNELNRFGWVVEIDPSEPMSRPSKRTALGRFKHEGAWVTLAKDFRISLVHEAIYAFPCSRLLTEWNPVTANGRWVFVPYSMSKRSRS